MEDIRRLIKKVSANLRQGRSAPDFWGLVRALEKSKPGQPRLGYAKHPSEENVRFGQMPHLYFPAADIAEVHEGGPPGVDATITNYFFGLLGANGPMPLEFTNYVFLRSHNGFDNTWRRFLDIIHHRFTVLYYRAFMSNRQSAVYDRPEDDFIGGMVKSFAGLPPEAKVSKNQESLTLAHAYTLCAGVKNRASLEVMLSRLLNMPLAVKDFVFSDYDIPQTAYAILGRRETSVLGTNLQIGTRFFSASMKYEVSIGPIGFEDYDKLMSGFMGFNILTDAVNRYLDRPLDYNLVFTLRGKSLPGARLGFDWTDEHGDAAQAGFTCWLGESRPDTVIVKINASRLNAKRHKDLFRKNNQPKRTGR